MELIDDLRLHGLQWRGAWQPTATDALPALPNQQPVALVAMVGIVGSTFWPKFRASAFFVDGLPDPLDRWSRSIAIPLAQRYGAQALFPFDGPPFHPFQQWADRAEPTQASPLKLRIHPEYGLWHAYRFALALPRSVTGTMEPTTEPMEMTTISLCASCSTQPCLRSCPVDAFDGENYLYARCVAHLQTPQGQPCMQGGCLARRACPVGQAFQYQSAHAAFHMQAFVRGFENQLRA
jgi:hypothetical protein